MLRSNAAGRENARPKGGVKPGGGENSNIQQRMIDFHELPDDALPT